LDYLIGWRVVAGKSKFISEVATISAVQHRTLWYLLVQEYLENNSLDQALFGFNRYRFPASENSDNHNRNRISSSPDVAPILSPVNVSDFSDITEGR
ncbi:hypothetical protein ES332_A10G054900v1, partial [Gossypium tomentosum]